MQKLAGLALIACGSLYPAPDAAAQAKPAAEQIAAAILAAPPDRRADARVLGYDAAGKLVTLRQGSNDMICLADDPVREGIEVNCYHISLEPFMARGRQLSEAGVQGMRRNEIRWAEAQEGKLKLPDRPAILYTVTGSRFDVTAGALEGEYRRSTIYIPYATTESTGLSTRSSTTDPWIMHGGTAGAHIMITPPRSGGGGGD